MANDFIMSKFSGNCPLRYGSRVTRVSAHVVAYVNVVNSYFNEIMLHLFNVEEFTKKCLYYKRNKIDERK